MTHHVYCDVLLNYDWMNILFGKLCRNVSRIPSGAKIIFSPEKSFDSYRVDSRVAGHRSKNCGKHRRSKSKGDLRRFRKSEIRTRGGWSDVIKLVTSRCAFNGPYCALFLKRSEYRSLDDLALLRIIARIRKWWEIGRSAWYQPGWKKNPWPDASAFLAVINKGPSLRTPRFFGDGLTGCNRSTDLQSS